MNLKEIAHSVCPPAFWSALKIAIGRAGVAARPSYPSIEGALQCLKQRGFEPRFAIDVGAYHGEWTRLFKKLFPTCAVVMVEAQEAKRGRLRAVCEEFVDSVEYRVALLGSTSGQRVRFVQMESGSSVFEEKSPYTRQAVEMVTMTLDGLLETELRRVDFLKLDVQGYELEVLRGASQLLGHAQGVLMEASLIPVNEGAPLIADVILYMQDQGFRLVDFCSQIRRKDGVLWQTDLLFLRRDSPLVPDPKLTHENWF